MLKQAIKKLEEKFFLSNPMLYETLHEVFKTRPVTAALVSLYMLPVRKLLMPPEYLTSSSLTLTASTEYYKELHGLLHIAKAEGYELVRTGQDNDGGYVMLDDFPGGIAYSFGINNDVSWDKDMAARGYDIFMYDHTIDGLPEQNARFHWSKFGIADGVTHDDRLKDLEELISRNGHENQRDMILKMDVEGAEWGFFERVKSETLSQFSQMTFEFHEVLNADYTQRILSGLRKINETHQLIHLHANNYCSNYFTAGGKNFCSSLETSYVLRDKYKLRQDYDVSLPLKVDMPNRKTAPEIEFGLWNREFQDDGKITSVVREV